MKCHNCNAIIPDERMNFCPECRVKLIKETPKQDVKDEKSNNSPLSVTRNKAIWKVEKGEIARRIDEHEFAVLDQISGLIVHEGVTAIVYVDGQKVCQLNGGVYDFVSKKEIDKVMDERVIDYSSIYGMGVKLWRGLIHLIVGKKVNEVTNDTSNAQLKTLDDVVRKLNSNSVIIVYLKVDNTFPMLYGTKVDDEASFVPMTIKTKYLDAEFGISIMAQITDFELFIKHYLVDKLFVTAYDIQKELENYIYNILQAELAAEEIDEFGLSPVIKDRISLRIKALDAVLYGVKIVNVTDITCSNKDFDRYRHLTKELYCSEKELDFLKRTNEFKNRLVCVENEQKIRQAKSDFEIMQALDSINRDKKLYEEEERQFYVMLSRQRKIREAKDEMELTKALNDIKQTNLLNEDEFEAFELSLDSNKYIRENVADIMRLQSLAELKKKEFAINAELLKCQISHESDIDVVRFDAYKQNTSQAIEKMNIMEVIYGKKHESRKSRLLEEQEITSLANRFKNSKELEDATNRNKLLFQELEGRKMMDDYEINRLKNTADVDIQIKKKIADAEIEAQKQKMDLVREKQEIGLSGLARLKAMKAEEAERKHRHEIEMKDRDDKTVILKAHLDHEVKMKELDNRKNYTAEQIFVDKMDSNSEAGKIYAASFSSAKELEFQRKLQEEMKKMQVSKDESNKEIVEILKTQLLEQKNMVDLGSISAMVNGLTNNLIGNQQLRERENFDRLERIATHRMGEFGVNANQRLNDERALKDEYREQMKHEQQRHDLHQDKALQYTTQVTEAEYKSNKSSRLVNSVQESSPVFYVEDYGEIPFQLEQLKGFVMAGKIHKQSIIRTPEAKVYAGDLSALRECFQQCDFIICPNLNCGKRIDKNNANKGFCPYCGNDLN